MLSQIVLRKTLSVLNSSSDVKLVVFKRMYTEITNRSQTAPRFDRACSIIQGMSTNASSEASCLLFNCVSSEYT